MDPDMEVAGSRETTRTAAVGASGGGARKLAEDDIWHAARRGDAAAIEHFIQAEGVSVASVDECGRTAGYYASLYGHTALGALLRDFEAREAVALAAHAAAAAGGGRAAGGRAAGTAGRDDDSQPREDEAKSAPTGPHPSVAAGASAATRPPRSGGSSPRERERTERATRSRPVMPPVAPRLKHLMSREAAVAEGIRGAADARAIDTEDPAYRDRGDGSNSKKRRSPRKFRRSAMSPAVTARSGRSSAALVAAGAGVMTPEPSGAAKAEPMATRAEVARKVRARKAAHMRSARERIRRQRLQEMVRRQQLEDLEVQKDKWMSLRGLKTGFEFTREQKRELKRWFNFLDADGSGEINIEELEDPLLSTGIARNQAELQRLLQAVDTDGSGEIGFDEFLAVLKPRGGAAVAHVSGDKKRATAARPRPSRHADKSSSISSASGQGGGGASSAFAALQKQLNDDNNPLPLQLLVTMHRRKFLLETIVGNPEQDERERRELRRVEEQAANTNNVYMLSQVRRRQRQREADKQQRMERLAALQAVVDRNKRRATAQAPTLLPAPSTGRTRRQSTPSTSRPGSRGPETGDKLALTAAESEHVAALRRDREAGSGLSASQGSGGGHGAHVDGAGGTQPGASGAARNIARNRARLLNSGTGMQFAPRTLDKGSKASRGGAGGPKSEFYDPGFGMPLELYDG